MQFPCGLRRDKPEYGNVAIYDLQIKKLNRAKRSIIGAAAYQARARYEDQRTGEIHDYSRGRREVLANGIVGWSGTAEALWQNADAMETRQNALLGRDWIIALPRELSLDQQRALVAQYFEEVRRRHAVDGRAGPAFSWVIHRGEAKSERPAKPPETEAGDEVAYAQHNVHVHALETSRDVDDDGRFGQRLAILDKLKTGSPEIRWRREAWSRLCNAALLAAGSAARIDHRSLAARAEAGDIPWDAATPREHLGPRHAAIERRAERARRQATTPEARAAIRGSWRAERNRRIEETRRLVYELEAVNKEIEGLEALTAIPRPAPSPPQPRPRRVDVDQPAAGLAPQLTVHARYQVLLLARHYRAALRHLGYLAPLPLFVDTDRPGIVRVDLHDGTRIYATPQRIGSDKVTDTTATVMAALAKAAGWLPPAIHGSDPVARDRLWIACRRAGLDPTGHDPSPAARKHWDAERARVQRSQAVWHQPEAKPWQQVPPAMPVGSVERWRAAKLGVQPGSPEMSDDEAPKFKL